MPHINVPEGVPGIRSLVSLPPGLLRMPLGRYIAVTAAGCNSA